MVTLHIRDLALYGAHGVRSEERELGVRIMVSAEAVIDAKATETDSIDDTVNYVELCDLFADICGDESHKTLESLAGSMGRAAMKQFPLISSLHLELSKHAVTAHPVDELGISLLLERDSR